MFCDYDHEEGDVRRLPLDDLPEGGAAVFVCVRHYISEMTHRLLSDTDERRVIHWRDLESQEEATP